MYMYVYTYICILPQGSESLTRRLFGRSAAKLCNALVTRTGQPQNPYTSRVKLLCEGFWMVRFGSSP